MKLLVTDYDNTFHISDENMKENVEASKVFMHDNLFVIATGRNYDSFKQQEKMYDMKYNYLITNNGATIIKGGSIIYNEQLDNDIKTSILNDVDFNKIENMVCCNGKDEVPSTNKLSKLYFKFYNCDEAKRVYDLIKSKYDVNVFLFDEVPSMDIVSKKVGKEKAIEYIANIENIKDIYVIGDSANDYEMIKKYHGYCSIIAKDQIKQIAKKEYCRVSDLIYEVMEDKI